jgi:hypothetical protein
VRDPDKTEIVGCPQPLLPLLPLLLFVDELLLIPALVVVTDIGAVGIIDTGVTPPFELTAPALIPLELIITGLLIVTDDIASPVVP